MDKLSKSKMDSQIEGSIVDIYEVAEPSQEGHLRRELKARHLSMIAIGGAIGTGLFLSSGYTVNQAGPGGALLAYALMGVMVYFLMTSLGEMATYAPVSGSFETFASKFVSPAFGFALGWNYWFNWAITLAVELVAASLIMKYWFPGVPPILWCVIFGAALFGLNILSARAYGEAEFWFAGIKVAAVLIFLAVGALMITGVIGGHAEYGVRTFFQNGGALPNGLKAVVAVSFAAAFSFQGTELVGIAAGESEDPGKNIPKAINSVFWRILLFYLGAMIVIGAVIPWQNAGVDVSPFVMVYEKLGFKWADTAMNLVVLTSVLSAGNSSLYASSRMIYAMSKEGKAPRVFAGLSKNGVPIAAVLFTTAIGAFSLLTGFYANDTVYIWLLSASGIAGLIAWLGIAISHYRFRRWYVKSGKRLEDLKYKAKWYPFGPIFAIILVVVVIAGQSLDPAASQSLIFGLPLFLTCLIGYKVVKGSKITRIEDIEDFTESELKN